MCVKLPDQHAPPTGLSHMNTQAGTGEKAHLTHFIPLPLLLTTAWAQFFPLPPLFIRPWGVDMPEPRSWGWSSMPGPPNPCWKFLLMLFPTAALACEQVPSSMCTRGLR
ncbi:hypothetical protein KIL84_023069 [Mauremys mutica]|uniref:Uncharacterized protein n=1 Tax=Mauremys mutica TaxID=74926 RepID=A0A9D4ARE2_9SAUR|nr:hypothetical protein KIL84_023069 [Mauremys mutica]